MILYEFEQKTSKSVGYATATMQVGFPGGGNVQLFYQTPSQQWHYFMGTQQTIGCESYNTTDIKRAFLGEVCGATVNGVYDPQSTVQL